MTIFSDFTDANSAAATVDARGLEAFLRMRISQGTLPAGTRLPPIREAAWELHCAPGTVARAYRGLVVAGLAHGEVGRGTFVGAAVEGATFPPPAAPAAEDGGAGLVDLALNAFRMVDPAPLLSPALAEAVARLDVGQGYIPAGGERSDREAALAFLSRWRDDLDIDCITVTGGTQPALFATLLALRDQGALACEALTYPGVLSIAQAVGTRVHAVAMDEQGMCPEALDHLARRGGIGAVFVMSGRQNPTGRIMSGERIVALAEVAARHGLTIVEDQVYGFLSPEVPASFSRLLPEQTVLVSGLAKCVSPVLRVGYAAAPPLLNRRIRGIESAMLLMVSPVLTHAARLVLKHSDFERRLHALRCEADRRAGQAAAILPDVRAADMTGGIAWMRLGNGWRAEDFAQEAERLGVRVSPSRHFAVDTRAAPEAVRICLAAEPDEGRLGEALARLASLAGQAGERPPVAP
uniref:aminotransferase-like domain-containing protein n=1 Tax=Stappia sp. TaxID=1870903 RepID=UPI003BAA2FCE